MLKFGIYSVEQLRSGKITTIFGRRKRIAISLLNDIQDDERATELFEWITRDLVDDRGSFKRTLSNRFGEFDSLAIDILAQRFGGDDPLTVHDIGVSNAITSVAFHDSLTDAFPNVDFLATDYDHRVKVIRDGSLKLTLSSKGTIIEITYPPFVFTPLRPEHALAYPVNRLICFILLRTSVTKLLERYRAGGIDPKDIETVELFCPAAQRLARSSGTFRLGTYDLLTPPAVDGAFFCVRAMNVLNPNYFDGRQIRLALAHIAASLKDGGVLIAGSNQDAGSEVCGGIFQYVAGRFEALSEIGENDFLREHIGRFNARTVT